MGSSSQPINPPTELPVEPEFEESLYSSNISNSENQKKETSVPVPEKKEPNASDLDCKLLGNVHLSFIWFGWAVQDELIARQEQMEEDKNLAIQIQKAYMVERKKIEERNRQKRLAEQQASIAREQQQQKKRDYDSSDEDDDEESEEEEEVPAPKNTNKKASFSQRLRSTLSWAYWLFYVDNQADGHL